MGLAKTVWRGLIDKLPPPLRNRYVVAAILFLAWMLIFDSANLLTQLRLVQSVNRLKQDKVYYEDAIRKAEAERKTLEQDKETFAREQYFMQKDDEEVFILVEE
jgi:cell division protein FtsB